MPRAVSDQGAGGTVESDEGLYSAAPLGASLGGALKPEARPWRTQASVDVLSRGGERAGHAVGLTLQHAFMTTLFGVESVEWNSRSEGSPLASSQGQIERHRYANQRQEESQNDRLLGTTVVSELSAVQFPD